MKKNVTKFTNSMRVVHTLMLKSFFESNIGLFDGQMGVALAISKLYEHTKNEILLDSVYDLLELILSKINKGLSFSFSNGLSGIGWGIEYLIQHKLVEGESVEICEEIDKKIMETDPRRIVDYSLETGFEGLLLYIVYHLQGAIQQGTKLPFDNTYLSDIYFVCKNINGKKVNKSLNTLSEAYISFAKNKMIPDYELPLIGFATNVPKIDFDKLTTYPLGLNNGIAGVLVHLLEKDIR